MVWNSGEMNMEEWEAEMKYYGMSSVETGEHVFSAAGGLEPNFTSKWAIGGARGADAC